MNNNPITFITGTSRGIGRYLAEYYADNNHIVIGCSRGNTDLERENYTHFQADLKNEKDITAIFKHIKKTYGRLDNLVNNAGVGVSSPALLTTTSVFEDVMAINATGTFICIREAAKIMMKNNYGRIVNFTSGGVVFNLDGALPYTVSKAAVEMLTKSFANELAPYKITVNAVAPGVTNTEMLSHYMSQEKYDELMTRNYMIKEESTPHDLANAINFFLQKESNRVTGQIVYLCGPK